MARKGAKVTWGQSNASKSIGTVIDSYQFKQKEYNKNTSGYVLLVKTADGRYTLKLENQVKIIAEK